MPDPQPTDWTSRLTDVMPFGSSTASKAPTLLPDEPPVIVRGDGCRVWDDAGREFIDFRNGLGPVTLGYRFPAVDNAIRAQLDSGIVFGHPHPLECEVAELIRSVVPCAENVRFLKTGGEAIAACVRLARAHTQRDHVVQVGYNGWINSLAAGARTLPGQTASAVPPGVPAALAALHHAAPWDDLPALERLFAQFPNQVAAVVIAADYRHMPAGQTFYPAVRQLADRHGALLVFDEIVTGFRIANAGVQEYFRTTPDLAVFAKGVANGMPLSVYCGRRDVMRHARPASISTTYGGETLSLAAAKATLQTYLAHDVVAHIRRQSERLWTAVNALAKKHNVPLSAEGLPPCPALTFATPALRESFLRAAYRHGLSLYDVSYVNFSHKDPDITEALARFDRALAEVAAGG
jgi:glutamate-1-semialdehyde 2,1-aminomutase